MAEFDYIVVGAGSAGCALVNRLVGQTDATILLIEAGGQDSNPFLKMPRGFTKVLEGTKEVWRFQTDPSVAGPNPIWTRGKVLGGSSSVNGMVYMRGRPEDYDALNIPGWGWEQVGRAYQEMENHELGAGGSRGNNGPLKISVHGDRSDVCDAMISAIAAHGAVVTPDLNQEDEPAVGYQPGTIHRGQRVSAATAFLNPVKNAANLTIMTDTLVDHVVFEGKRAVGVSVRRGGGREILRARREVILAAGALHTPKILMLSGIGPADELARHGIDLRAAAPEVGQNMSEQIGFMPMFGMRHGSQNQNLRGLGLVKSVLSYALGRKGPLTHGCFEMSGVIKTRPELKRPNAIIQFAALSVDFNKATGKVVPSASPGAMMTCYVINPRSRGYLTITSADPDAPITWDPKYLTDPQDRADAVDLVRAVRAIVAHPALREFGFVEQSPGPGVQTDEEIIAHYLQYGTYAYHALGTCRMGVDDNSVVDPRLNVRGVEGLRVADLSVIPEMVSSHTNAPAMMVGWRAGQIILEDNMPFANRAVTA